MIQALCDRLVSGVVMTRHSRVRSRIGIRKRIALVAALAVALLPVVPVASAAQSSDDAPSIERLWGQDRYATSLAVARRFVQESGGSIDAVVIVSGSSWRDAVIAAGLAGSLDAPVLLTPANGLSAEAEAFLTDSGVTEAVVVGGGLVVSHRALTGLRELVGSAERISGINPSAASVAVAERMGMPGHMTGKGRTVILASSDVFVDAMVAGGFSARGSHPVLLTPGFELSSEVIDYVLTGDVDHAVIMGGPAAISEEADTKLRGLGVDTTRLGGRTRFSTAQVVAEFIEGMYASPSGGKCFDRSTAGLATAHVPFDSFGAGPLLGLLCAPLLLTEVKQMDASTVEWLRADTRSLIVFGGTAVVSGRALAEITGEEPEDEAPPEPVFDFDNPDRSTIDGILAEAAARRAAAVADITANIRAGKYGIGVDNVLRGPASFRIDLNECPYDWSDTTGITASRIRIGHTAPHTGTLRPLLDISVGMENYFDWVNENDPIVIHDRERHLSIEVKDDKFIGFLTVDAIDEFVEAGNIFSVLTFGARPTVAAAERANEGCIPHLFNISTQPAAGDPVHRPWTTGSQLSYSTEAILWAEWIKRNLQDQLPVRVSALVADQDEHYTWHDTFVAWAEANPDVISEFSAFTHPVAFDSLSEQMVAIKQSKPDVLLSMTFGPACLSTMRLAESNGLKADIEQRGGAMFVPSICQNVESYVRPAGNAADGWRVAGGGTKFPISRSAGRTDFDEEPFFVFMRSNLEAAGLDPQNHRHAWGYFIAYPYVEAMRIAAELPGGLSRTNLVLVTRSLEIYHPLVLNGIRTRLNGNADAFFLEGSEFYQFDASAGDWKKLGGVINVNAKTPNCAWDADNGFCR